MTHTEFVKTNTRFNEMYDKTGLPNELHTFSGRKRQASKYRSNKGLTYKQHLLNPVKKED